MKEGISTPAAVCPCSPGNAKVKKDGERKYAGPRIHECFRIDTAMAEKALQLTDEGIDDLDARYAVSRLLEHNRADVTNVYLAALKKYLMD